MTREELERAAQYLGESYLPREVIAAILDKLIAQEEVKR